MPENHTDIARGPPVKMPVCTRGTEGGRRLILTDFHCKSSAYGIALMAKSSAAPTHEKVQAARARATERMRRSRRRRNQGMRCYMLELEDAEIAALVRRGLLAPGEQTDRAAVLKAMYAFLDRTLGRPM
jgi:hypothetical protein